MRTKRSDGVQCHYGMKNYRAATERKSSVQQGREAVCSLKADALFRKSAAQQITQTVILPVHALYTVF